MKKSLLPLIIFILLACFLWKPTPSLATELREVEETESLKLLEKLKESFEYSIRFLTSGTYQDVSNSSQNPNNDFFRIPRYLTELELRPDARLNFRRLELSVKPRLNVGWNAWEDGPRKGDDEFDDDLFINEWLARIRIAEGLFVSYGREIYNGGLPTSYPLPIHSLWIMVGATPNGKCREWISPVLSGFPEPHGQSH